MLNAPNLEFLKLTLRRINWGSTKKPISKPIQNSGHAAKLLEFGRRDPYLLLLGDVLPELAGLLLERLHRRHVRAVDQQASGASPAVDRIWGGHKIRSPRGEGGKQRYSLVALCDVHATRREAARKRQRRRRRLFGSTLAQQQ